LGDIQFVVTGRRVFYEAKISSKSKLTSITR